MRTLLLILSFIALQAQGQQLFHAHNKATGCGYDPDVCAYLTRLYAADYTPAPGEKAALNTLIDGMKSAGVYSNMVDFGLYMGATEAAHVLSFKNAFNLSYPSSSVHDAGGAIGISLTGIVPATHLTHHSTAFGFYSQSAGEFNNVDMGADEADISRRFILYASTTARGFSEMLSDQYSYTYGRISYTGANTGAGFYVSSRTANNALALYINGAQVATLSTTETTAMPTNQIAVGGNYNGTIAPGNRKVSFWFVSTGLSDTQVATLSTLVNDFQTALGRNKY
jgi:hypothetical protein